MAWMDGVDHNPIPSSNYASGAIGSVRGIQLHHTESTFASALAWFSNPTAQASAHFIVRRDGYIVQCVSTSDAAYAACMSNYEGWISIENEGFGDEGLTPQQIAACARILKWAHDTHGVPMQVTNERYVGGVSYHGMIPGPCGQFWGQTSCPGPTIPGQRQAVVDAAIGALAPAPAPVAQEEDDMVMVCGQLAQPTNIDGTIPVPAKTPVALLLQGEHIFGTWAGDAPYGIPSGAVGWIQAKPSRASTEVIFVDGAKLAKVINANNKLGA